MSNEWSIRREKCRLHFHEDPSFCGRREDRRPLSRVMCYLDQTGMTKLQITFKRKWKQTLWQQAVKWHLGLIHEPFLFSGIIEILGFVMKDFRMQKSFNFKREVSHWWCVERYLKRRLCVLFEFIIISTTTSYELQWKQIPSFLLSSAVSPGLSSVVSRNGDYVWMLGSSAWGENFETVLDT